jgi:hypothetical protein
VLHVSLYNSERFPVDKPKRERERKREREKDREREREREISQVLG